MNSVNGMSAVADAYGLFYSLFAVCFMNYQICYWNTMNQDLNPYMNEKELPYSMSDLYAYCRKDIKQFFWFYAGEIAVIGVFVIITQSCIIHMEVMGEEGHTYGFFVIGLVSVYQVVVSHHVLLFTVTNSIDPFYLLIFPFSFVWVWVVSYLEDINPMSYYY